MAYLKVEVLIVAIYGKAIGLGYVLYRVCVLVASFVWVHLFSKGRRAVLHSTTSI